MLRHRQPALGSGDAMSVIRLTAGLSLIAQFGLAAFFAASGPAGASTAFSALYDFQGTGDGVEPAAGLISDASGALYGTTYGGSTTSCGSAAACGAVFKLTPPTISGGAWTESVLYSFAGGRDVRIHVAT